VGISPVTGDEALQQEHSRITAQLKFAERRIATLEAAAERDKRQAVVGEADDNLRSSG
jgi:hypothetical protein